MGDGQTKWPEDRPRWGTYSVKGHTELARLIPDLLMHDVIVFPSPDTDDEFARWEREGWAPDLLARRVTQLGDHAVVCPWDATLRGLWEGRMTNPSDQPEDAFTTTAAVIAEQSFRTLMGEEDDRYHQVLLESPKVRTAFGESQAAPRARTESLELVAAFHAEADLAALTGARTDGVTRAEFQGTAGDGIRLRFRLEFPEQADEDTLHRTLDLIENEDFQVARRRLWSFEKELPEKVDSAQLANMLDALVEDYNRQVRRENKATTAALVFLIVPAAAGIGIDGITGGGITGAVAGIGSSVFFDKVKARFPTLEGGAARASHHPGSAVAGMLAIAGHVESLAPR